MLYKYNTKVWITHQAEQYRGVVIDGRHYGSDGIKYTVKLDTPIKLRWRDEIVSTVLIKDNLVKAIK
jgi:hypothetical protein